MFKVTVGYAPRRTRFTGVCEHRAWKLKTYEITCDDEPIDDHTYDEGLPVALNVLPAPAESDVRPGAGFIIRHQGRGMHYLVLCWWDNENELPIRVWVKPRDDAAATWRPAGDSESVCVWDLHVIEFERRAYIEHVLARPDAVDLESYLARSMAVGAASSDSPS